MNLRLQFGLRVGPMELRVRVEHVAQPHKAAAHLVTQLREGATAPAGDKCEDECGYKCGLI